MSEIKKMTLMFLIFTFVFSCKEDNPVGPLDSDFAFPLEVGNRWQYIRTFSNFNVRGDTSGLVVIDTTITANITMSIAKKDTLSNAVETFLFEETEAFANGETFEAVSHYANQPDGLYLYAHSPINIMLIKPSRQPRILFAGRPFNEVRDVHTFIKTVVLEGITNSDSLVILDPPVQSLPYPLKIDQQWLYNTGGFFTIHKKVLGVEKVETAAGSFDCVKIQWLIELGNDIEFFDFICEKGLVKRSLTVKDLVVTTEDGPDETGILFDSTDEFELTHFNFE